MTRQNGQQEGRAFRTSYQCHFGTPELYRCCESLGVDLSGIGKNQKLLRLSEEWMKKLRPRVASAVMARHASSVSSHTAPALELRLARLVKAEHNAKGANPRYLVTSLAGDPRTLYEELYCARGEMENRIKEQQLDLFADRTSSTEWWTNQLRLLMSTFAYVLVENLRRFLTGTELERAYVGTIRLRLLKIGGVVLRNTRRIVVKLSSVFPGRYLFEKVLRHMAAA
ncbi:MAG: transposase [Myxococcales bacterium]|nr:transposase [Myxococcales bacterium]